MASPTGGGLPTGPDDPPDDPGAQATATPLQRTQDAVTMLRHVIAALRALAHADAAAILLYDRENALFVPAVPSVAVGLDERWLQRQGLEAAQSLALRAVEAHDIVEVLDTASTPELDFPLLAGGRRPGAVGVIPLEVEGSVVGVLGVYHARPRTAHLDGSALRAFAALCGLAITMARAHERESTLLARLEALDEATRALAAELSLDTVLRRIVEVAARVADARYGALGVVGDDGYLTDFITTGISPQVREQIGPLPRGYGLLGVLIREGRPLRVPNIYRDPRRVGFPPHHPPMTSLLGVPVRVRHEVVGDLYLTDKIGAAEFSEEDQHLVELLAAHAGVAIENARLYAREQHAHHVLQRQAATLRRQAELIDLAHDAIIVRDPHNAIVQWNQGAVDTYGWTADQAQGQVIHTLLQTRFPIPLEEIETALADAGAWEGELVHTRQDGARIVVESRQVLVREVQGTPTAILEINRNVTQRKRAEEALRLLAQTGTLLATALDEQETLAALARLAVPTLGDWCTITMVEDEATLCRRVVAHGDPTRDDPVQLRNDRYPCDRTAPCGVARVVRTGQPELVAAVTDADLATLATTEAHLAFLRHAGLVSSMIVPLLSGGTTIGAIAFASAESGRRYTPEDLTLAEDVARRAALAVANARLHAQVQELTTLRERERIGRDLHDGVIQDIYAGTLQMEALAEDLPDEMQERLLGVADYFSGVIQDVRTYIKGLRARELEGRLLSEGLATLVQEVGGRSDLAATYAVEGTPYRVPDETANALLQITREALSNVIKHAAATTAHVRLAYAGEGVTLTIADDGRGFDPEQARGEEHRGLRNLRMRAVEVEGVFSVQSALGAGTTISVSMPARRD